MVVEAIGDLAPHRLGETGRRELRHILRSVEMSLVGLALPTRRPFDTTDQLDERMRRADAAFAMAYELGTKLVLAACRRGPAGGRTGRGAKCSPTRCASWAGGPSTTGSGWRWKPARSRGEKLKSFLDALASPGLAASIDPAASCKRGSTRSRHVRELAAGSCMPTPTTRPARPAVAASTRAVLASRPVPSIGKSTWARSKKSATAAS